MKEPGPTVAQLPTRRLPRDARGGFALFRIAGIQVRADPSWLVIVLLIWWSLSAGYFPRAHPEAGAAASWAAGLLAALLFFASLLLHELSHSLVARRYGHDVRSITLFLFGGAAEMSSEPEDPGTELRIAAAGPLASFALAAVFGLGVRLLPPATPDLLAGVVGYLAWVNLALGVFNLLPGFPLDGGRILRALIWRRTGSLRKASRVSTQAGKGLGLGLALLGGVQIFSGALVGGIWLVLIGLFARGLAETSYQSLLLREQLEAVSVADVMVREPVTVGADLPLDRLVDDYILGRGFRGFPVVEDGRALGLISVDRVRGVPAAERPQQRVRDHLEPLDTAHRVTPETPLLEALESMGSLGLERLLVMRPGSSELLGLLTKTGLVRFVELRRALGTQEGRG
jgi:Zn-dependent protease/CBS domain-containing protein